MTDSAEVYTRVGGNNRLIFSYEAATTGTLYLGNTDTVGTNNHTLVRAAGNVYLQAGGSSVQILNSSSSSFLADLLASGTIDIGNATTGRFANIYGTNIDATSATFTGNITVGGTVDGVDISSHASRHITGGADEIDGDRLNITWNPLHYTPSTAPSEATSVDDLTAHLFGIDQALGSVGAGPYLPLAGGTMVGDILGNATPDIGDATTGRFGAGYFTTLDSDRADFINGSVPSAPSGKSSVYSTSDGLAVRGASQITELSAEDTDGEAVFAKRVYRRFTQTVTSAPVVDINIFTESVTTLFGCASGAGSNLWAFTGKIYITASQATSTGGRGALVEYPFVMAGKGATGADVQALLGAPTATGSGTPTNPVLALTFDGVGDNFELDLVYTSLDDDTSYQIILDGEFFANTSVYPT
jgi:hypothetical protein